MGSLHYMAAHAPWDYRGVDFDDTKQINTAIVFVALLAGMVILVHVKNRWPRGLVAADKIFGNLTYPLYLFHLIVLSLFFQFGAKGSALYVAAYAAVILVSAAIFFAVEWPIMGIRTRRRRQVLD